MRRFQTLATLCVLGAACLSHPALLPAAGATTYLVRPDGTGDFPTIQAALDGAADGDIIELADGTFTGDGNRDLDYRGKTLSVRSQGGVALNCRIDCQGTQGDPHRGFHFHSGESSGAQLDGVMVTGGWAIGHPIGGAVLCELGSAPQIRDCIFSANRYAALACFGGSAPALTGCSFANNQGQEGGAVFCEASSPTFTDCDFSHNSALWHGGAFCGSPSSAEFIGCHFTGNEAGTGGAVIVYFGGEPLFRDCLFEGNTSIEGPAAMLLFGFVIGTLDGCTFVGNYTQGYGTIVGTGKMDHLIVRNCTFWGNSANNGAVIGVGEIDAVIDNTLIAFNQGCVAVGGEHPVTISCCDLCGNENGDWVGSIADQYGIRGNISEDPLLCDPHSGDFMLDCSSPCAPFSPPNPECDLIGAWPVGCGASPSIESSWGGIKTLFRR